jgi:RNA polymerase sigma factor (sigma-70 family)
VKAVKAGMGSHQRSGWDQRFGRLYEDLRRPARAMVRRAFGGAFGESEVEDIYGNAWLATLRALEKRQDELSDGELRKYLLTAVANHASKELRRRGRRPTAPLEAAPDVADVDEQPDERAANREESQLTRDVLGTLPPRRRAVLLFRYGWGLKPEEVCGLIKGLSPRAYRKVKAASAVEGTPQEPFALAAAAPLTQLAAPEVDPVNAREDASGTVNCQTDITVSTELENQSPDLAAQSAQVSLNLPPGVQLIGGSQTQTVSGGELEPSTPTSETHSWTVRATSSGTKQLTVTGQGGTMAETFTSPDQVSFEADCSPPAVKPTGTSITPDGIVECGTDRVIQTRLLNDSHTDAENAQVSLAVSSGVEVIGSFPSQTVSNGLLELQTTSEPHAWTVRQTHPGIAPLTLTGSGQSLGQTYTYLEELALACTSAPDPGPDPGGLESRTTLEEVKLRRGRLVARGTVENSAGAPIGGEVVVTWEKGQRTRDKGADLAAGTFKATTRICQAGRWKARARYTGEGAYAASSSRTVKIKVRDEELRC